MGYKMELDQLVGQLMDQCTVNSRTNVSRFGCYNLYNANHDLTTYFWSHTGGHTQQTKWFGCSQPYNLLPKVCNLMLTHDGPTLLQVLGLCFLAYTVKIISINV